MDTNSALAAFVASVVAAIAGAIVGALITRRLAAARPVLLVDTVDISNSAIPGGAVVTPRKELVTACNLHPFIGMQLVMSSNRRVKESEYVDWLGEVERTLDDLLAIQLPAMKAVGDQLAQGLATKNFELIERLWGQEQDLIWPYVESAWIRDDFVFSTREPTYSEHSEARVVIVDEDGDFILQLPKSPVNLAFIWTRRVGSMQARTKELASRASKAIAYRIVDDLNDIANFLVSAEKLYEGPAKDLRNGILRELQNYQRLSVTGQVSNIGSAGFSVLNLAHLSIHLQGYPTPSGLAASDLRLALMLGDDQSNFETPITVPGGQVRRFHATATKRLGDLTEQATVRSAYEGAERPFAFEIDAVLPGSARTRRFAVTGLFHSRSGGD